MFTWSFGCTSLPASVAITSFAFVFELVPEPVWKTSIGNWSSNSPAATRSAAAAMRSARSRSSRLQVGVHARRRGLDPTEPARDGNGNRLAGDREVGDRLLGLAAPERLLLCCLRHRGESSSGASDCLRWRRLSVETPRSSGAPAGTYLNTASYGLPPRPAWDALQAALEDWRGGRTSWEHWGVPGEDARASFARLVGVPVETVAIAANVSTLVGLVAASIPDGSRVLAPDVEFTSVLFPFLVQESRGVSVRLVPAAELAGEIGPDVDVVAFSAVQMATGEVADLDEHRRSCSPSTT